MTAFSSPDDEIDGTEDIIRISDVKERIRNIMPFKVLPAADGLSLSDDLPAYKTWTEAEAYIDGQPEAKQAWLLTEEYLDESAELKALQQLLSDLGDIGDGSYLIHDEHLEKYAQNDNEMDLDNPLWYYVDWERVVAENYKASMPRIEFRNNIYWVAVR